MIKVYKLSVFLVSVTLMAVLYVHQQVQLLKISYRIESNEKKFTTLLDRNRALMYNISRLKSPVYLEEKFLSTKKDFTIPQQWRVVEAPVPRLDTQPVRMENAGNQPWGIFKIFGRPREALAKTIK